MVSQNAANFLWRSGCLCISSSCLRACLQSTCTGGAHLALTEARVRAGFFEDATRQPAGHFWRLLNVCVDIFLHAADLACHAQVQLGCPVRRITWKHGRHELVVLLPRLSTRLLREAETKARRHADEAQSPCFNLWRPLRQTALRAVSRRGEHRQNSLHALNGLYARACWLALT